MRPWPVRSLKRACAGGADDSGTAAVEFGFIAPVLALAFLAMIDVGMAVNERLSIDSALRAGVQRTFQEPAPSATEVRDVVSTIASDDFTVRTAGAVSASDLLVSVDKLYACPESMATKSATSPSCAASADPYEYYRLTAEKYYNPVLLPQISMRSSLLVQVE